MPSHCVPGSFTGGQYYGAVLAAQKDSAAGSVAQRSRPKALLSYYESKTWSRTRGTACENFVLARRNDPLVRARGTYGRTLMLMLRNVSKSRSITAITQIWTNLFVISTEDSRGANRAAKCEILAISR